MADFEKTIRKHVNDDGNIPADSIPAVIQAVQKVVGESFVPIDRYNAKKTQVDELQTKLEESEGLQTKYDKLKADYDAYKQDQEKKATRTQKQEAYKDLLVKIGIPEKRCAAILKTVDLDKLELKDGKLVDADKLETEAKTEWEDFIVVTKPEGVDSATPPENNGGKDKLKSRAAELARRYQEQMYGKVEDNK